MFVQLCKVYLFVNIELEFDSVNGAQVIVVFKDVVMVVVFFVFKLEVVFDYVDVLLLILFFIEIFGIFVNIEGCVQSFNVVVKVLGEICLGWKVLCVFGNVFNLLGFEYVSSEEVCDEVFGGVDEFVNGFGNGVNVVVSLNGVVVGGVECIVDVLIYFVDVLVCCVLSLQCVCDVVVLVVCVNVVIVVKLGFDGVIEVMVKQGGVSVKFQFKVDVGVLDGVVCVVVVYVSIVVFGLMFG